MLSAERSRPRARTSQTTDRQTVAFSGRTKLDGLATLRNRNIGAKPPFKRAREAHRGALFTVNDEGPLWRTAELFEPFNKLIEVGVRGEAVDRLNPFPDRPWRVSPDGIASQHTTPERHPTPDDVP